MAAVEFEYPAGDIVEKVAVVGHRDHGAGKAFEKLLEPLHRQRVEVIGRLVEQQHLGFGQQQPAQRHTAPFATG